MARGKAKRRSGSRTAGRSAGTWKRVLPGLLVLLALLLIPLGMLGWSWLKLQRPYQGYAGDERIVQIEPGMGASQILERLQQEGVLADARLARSYLIYFMDSSAMQAGEYRFRGPLTTPQVLRMLVKGRVLTHSITVIEGLTLEEIATQLDRAGYGRRQAFLDLMRSPALVADLDPEAQDLEGYLFPETYSFARSVNERTIVQAMVRTFRERFEKEVRPLFDRNPRGTVRQLVTLASIVEKEAQVATERPLIAAVYRNRLDRGIGLMADPTVIYALKRAGRWNGNIRRDDLRMESPYNTYRYAGLPPGPICNPGLASLVAAAEPAEAPYFYFVSRNDGTHVFAETLAEHNRNVNQWQRKYWREKRAQERLQRQGNQGR
ncbi:MAG: endolytic transglycosylase MltG [Thermoanaerobaculia bacterium]